jgi:4,5-DOPA dioxygenase extradiol
LTPETALVRFDRFIGHGGAREKAPGMPYAHPTAEHFAPLFVALGAATRADAPPETKIDGFWYGLAKRSIELA